MLPFADYARAADAAFFHAALLMLLTPLAVHFAIITPPLLRLRCR